MLFSILLYSCVRLLTSAFHFFIAILRSSSPVAIWAHRVRCVRCSGSATLLFSQFRFSFSRSLRLSYHALCLCLIHLLYSFPRYLPRLFHFLDRVYFSSIYHPASGTSGILSRIILRIFSPNDDPCGLCPANSKSIAFTSATC